MKFSQPHSNYLRAAFSGFCCLLIALGINRFAYTPLIPALIKQGWVTQTGASYLGAINFIGYFIGAYLGQHASRYFKISKLIKTNLIISIIGLGLSALHFGYIWFAIWRFILGVTGAFLVVLTPSAILKNIQLNFRGRASGLIFSGIGAGIIISGFCLPYIASSINVSAAWIMGCIIVFAATLLAWSPLAKCPQTINIAVHDDSDKTKHMELFFMLNAAYVLFAIGVIPHTLFLVDYVHQQLVLSEVKSGLFWALYGVGALIGPFFAGFISDKIGIYKSLMFSYILSCVGVTLVLFNHLVVLYVLSSFIMGLILPTIVGLTSARIIELFGTEEHPKFWGKTTLTFAISQMLGTYSMSYILHLGYGYTSCFSISAIALFVGLGIICFAA